MNLARGFLGRLSVRRRHTWRLASTAVSNGSVAGSNTPKAAMVVIGDEILAGSIADVNTPWLAKLLHSRGVDLTRVEFIPDNQEEIKSTVLELKKRVGPNGFVFTSGGIGPTHDDVTYESIASAFGVDLQLHEPTVKRMKEVYEKRGLELNQARLRMATLPCPADEVLVTPDLWVPLVNLKGIYILPGIPKLFRAIVSAHQDRFTGPAFHTESLYTDLGEGDLAEPLAKVAKESPKVSIGSYPNTEDEKQQQYKVKLQLNGRDAAAVLTAKHAISEALGPSLKDAAV
ncbi:hypothetical protein CEUSTIGMA_g3717.t1 [Chlamydomonas eustigma]|uniref:MoaB/Mog domain-containing protein n=1 Tax=Chlamydomonas eustigma TaxID=1157962 RepID=A0A250WZK1_9CHLO|nr:hypothetical protein CEUSTIGMA_g3717.t1 [Chlamydomonas eustigma]|eukprot:GAX76273.1 hypothetical protein CEUSTIGMA_g3717.t1 [Chlamydomonas eustigma]